jgi:hypothetical protein
MLEDYWDLMPPYQVSLSLSFSFSFPPAHSWLWPIPEEQTRGWEFFDVICETKSWVLFSIQLLQGSPMRVAIWEIGSFKCWWIFFIAWMFK